MYPFDEPKKRYALLQILNANPGQANRELVLDYVIHKGWIQPNWGLEAWPYRWMPNTPDKRRAFGLELAQFEIDRTRFTP